MVTDKLDIIKIDSYFVIVDKESEVIAGDYFYHKREHKVEVAFVDSKSNLKQKIIGTIGKSIVGIPFIPIKK